MYGNLKHFRTKLLFLAKEIYDFMDTFILQSKSSYYALR